MRKNTPTLAGKATKWCLIVIADFETVNAHTAILSRYRMLRHTSPDEPVSIPETQSVSHSTHRCRIESRVSADDGSLVNLRPQVGQL
jgi:hypothetical protein